MCLDSFNLYKDLCSLIEYMLRFFKLFVLDIWNLLKIYIYIYISLFKDSYKYVVTISMGCISCPFEINKLIKYLNMIASIIEECVSS